MTPSIARPGGSPGGARAALRDGLRRVRRAPGLVLLMWAITLVMSLPLALGVRQDVERQLGSSLQAGVVARQADYDWLTAFSDQATGASATLTPAVIGFGAVVDNLSAFLDWEVRPVVLSAVAGAYLLAWTVLAGGIVERLARDRPLRAAGFGRACGRHGGSLLRLGLLSAVCYGILITRLHPWLFDDLFARWTDELDSERTAFTIRVSLYLVFAGVLALVNLWFDYARVRLVIEGRESAVGALRAGGRFIARRKRAAVGLYLCDVALVMAVLAAYGLVAPGAAGGRAADWFALALGQAYIAARLAVKLAFWASEAALFQGVLAPAGHPTRRGLEADGPAAAGTLDS